ncbi:MAG: efflux RND transporter permease subunit, partial [Candidatus Competibacteraceae bacterium]|nr:efflux RND transporter permease subunit [Candidatus Competibacteraceae bacterium]
YLRNEPQMADLRVTLADKVHRRQQSHALLLRLRRDLTAIAADYGADIKLVEAPPGPPVAATLTVELYGSETTPYATLEGAALELAARLKRESLVVDVDTSVETAQGKLTFVTDKEKAALSGIATVDIARTLALASGGLVAGHLQLPREANPLPLVLRLPLERRSSPRQLESLYVKGRPGITKLREKGGVRDAPQPLVQLGELGAFRQDSRESTIYHKNLRPVAYVFAEPAGRPPAAVVLDVAADQGLDPEQAEPRPLAGRSYLDLGSGDPWQLPPGVEAVWTGEGEWFITLRVFRDLGIAFGVALVGIFMVLWLQTGLAALAGIIMLAIPLTVIGIMPGFWLLNQLGERVVDGFPDPVLFTATAMIGMIALAGIVVRNSLILVEFVQLALGEGQDLQEALIQAGAIRMRPVFLTAGTTLLGNLVITLDPIFAGLAWAIIFGILASTLFTLAVVPVVYYLVYQRQPGHGLPTPAAEEEA